MDTQRREVIKGFSGAALLKVLAAAGFIAPHLVHAEWNKAAFDMKNMADALKALGAGTPLDNKEVRISGPEIAEDGAVVPVSVTTVLPNVSLMGILVEKNPLPLVATFTLGEGMDAFIQTEIKMAQTSNVFALIKADGKFYSASREIKVTTGDCCCH